MLPKTMEGGKTWAHVPPMLLDAGDLGCPAGEGPCMVYYQVKQNCPPATAGSPANLLAGFIDCD